MNKRWITLISELDTMPDPVPPAVPRQSARHRSEAIFGLNCGPHRTAYANAYANRILH